MLRWSGPWWLASLALAPLPVLLAVRARRRGRHIHWAAVVLQALALGAGALALARPSAPLGDPAARKIMVLRDVSGSARGQARPLGLPAGLPVETVEFAGELSTPAPGSTRAAPALRLAAAAAREGRLSDVIVATDGQFQDAAVWPAAARALGTAGIDVTIVPLRSPPRDVRVSGFTARRRPYGRCELRVTAIANAPASRRLVVRREAPSPIVLLDRRLEFLAADPVTVVLTDSLPPDAAGTYRAELSAGDAFGENDATSASVLPAAGKVALVSAGPEPSPERLATALGLAVVRLSADEAPTTQARWADYAAVVLTDATGTLLDAGRRSALAEYVRSGGGLVLIGAGPHGSPADRQDDLNRVCPLVPDPHERRPLLLTVVLDASGSMGEPIRGGDAAPSGRVKFDRARDAVLALRRHLTRSDALTVLTFAARPERVYTSGDGGVDFPALRSALGDVRPAGPTKVIPALQLATAQPPPEGREGFVLLLSDLRTEDYAAEQVDALADRFAGPGWSLAVVAVRGAAEQAPPRKPLLEVLAERLSAPLVPRADLAGLGEVFVRLLRRHRGEAVRRGRFATTGQRELFGLAETALPELDAYVLTAPRQGAEVLASVAGDALLARWQVGLGRSVSLAVSISGRDNAALRAWPKWDALVAAAARWVRRPKADPRFDAELTRRDEELRVTVRARDDAGPMNLRALTLRLGEAEATLEQTGPGRSETRLPAPAGATAWAVLDGPRVVLRGVAGDTIPREYAAIGPDWETLRRLAALTGGRIVSRRELADMAPQLGARRYSELWPWLLAAAVALMLVEWAATRVWRRTG